MPLIYENGHAFDNEGKENAADESEFVRNAGNKENVGGGGNVGPLNSSRFFSIEKLQSLNAAWDERDKDARKKTAWKLWVMDQVREADEDGRE